MVELSGRLGNLTLSRVEHAPNGPAPFRANRFAAEPFDPERPAAVRRKPRKRGCCKTCLDKVCVGRCRF